MLLRLLSLVALLPVHVAGPTFSETVLRDFDAWDADHDGVISQAEVDRAALDPQYHRQDAAALASLHVWLSTAKDSAPKLTKEWFQSYQPVRLNIEKGTAATEARQMRKEYAKTPGSLQSNFTGALRRLMKKTGATTLYETDGPTLSDIRQGALGDCYMLAPLGAVVYRDPQAIRRMIQTDGPSFKVAFGDGKEIKVGPLTDAEIAMGGSAFGAGLWIRVMEKAYGSRKFADSEARISRDVMSGGSPAAAGKALTGKSFSAIRLYGDYKKTIKAEDLNGRMKSVRDQLLSAFDDHRLVLASTPGRDMPKSISGNHAYALLSYDKTADTLTIWNPHGNDFKPSGEDSFENGYKRKGGVFTISLDNFCRAFGRVYFEGK